LSATLRYAENGPGGRISCTVLDSGDFFAFAMFTEVTIADPGTVLSSIAGELSLRYAANFETSPKGEPVHVTRLVKIIALGKGRVGRHTTLRNTGNGAQIFDVGRKEEAAVVQVKRVRGVGEEIEPNARAPLRLGSGK